MPDHDEGLPHGPGLECNPESTDSLLRSRLYSRSRVQPRIHKGDVGICADSKILHGDCIERDARAYSWLIIASMADNRLITWQEVMEIVKGIDTDGNGTIDIDEWENGIVLAKYKVYLQLAMANNYLDRARFTPILPRPRPRPRPRPFP